MKTMTTAQLSSPAAFDITNVLRVLATMFVFTLHGRGSIPGIGNIPVLRTLSYLPAWAGVWIFFLLSGYTLGLGFCRGRYDVFGPDGKLSAKGVLRFYLGRFLKIAPLYYIYCLFFELFNGQYYFISNPVILLKTLTFAFNGNGGIVGMGHLWYISTAVQLYLIFPFAYALIRKLDKKTHIFASFAAVLAAGLLLRMALHILGLDWYTWIYTFSPCNVDLVVCGMLVAHYKTKYPQAPAPAPLAKGFSLLLFLLLVAYNVYVYSNSFYLNIYRIYLPSLYILSCAVLLLYFAPASAAKTVRKGLWSLVDWFSAHSYSFFVFHILALEYAANVLSRIPFYTNGSGVVRFFAFYALSFGIALVCGVLADRMMSNLQRRAVPARQ